MIEDGVLSLWGSGCWPLRIVPHYDGQHERRLITHESSLLTAVIEEGVWVTVSEDWGDYYQRT